MLGILAEKPSAARNFAKALGGMTGSYNGEKYVIAASMGHLYEFDDVKRQVPKVLEDSYASWDLEYLPWDETKFSWLKILKNDRGQAKVLNDIKLAFKDCDEICIATDDDPTGEGELLAWEVLDNLGFRPKKYSRMFFPDEAVASIQKAFKNRKPIKSKMTDMDFVKADYRSKFDYLTIQFTRIATKCGDGKAVLRQGRLKSAMVYLTGDAINRLEEWKKNKKPFYQNKFRDENGVIYTNPDAELFESKDLVPQNLSVSAVKLDSSVKKATPPRPLLDLAGLSSSLAPKGLKSKDLLSVYQKMYENQIVSYPRTEDKQITIEQFNDLLPHVDAICKLVGVDPKLISHRTPRKTHIAASAAHGANRPGLNVPKSMADIQAVYGQAGVLIYEMLAKNYLAMMAEDYLYESQKGVVVDYRDYVGTASVPISMGWKLVFNNETEDDEDVSAKGIGKTATPFVHEGFPPKPPTPTYKWLMKELAKYDVGTGATRVTTYADVTSDTAKYPLLKDKKGSLSMSDFGNMSYLLLKDTKIGSVKVSEDLQKNMKLVGEGRENPDRLLRQVRDMVEHDIAVMKKNGESMRKTLGIEMAAPAVQKEKTSAKFKGKDVKFNKEWSGHVFTDEELEKLLRGEEIVIEAVSAKTGKPFRAQGKFAQQTYKGKKFYGFKLINFL